LETTSLSVVQKMSSQQQQIWFLLLDSTSGLAYKNTTADKVSVSSSADVADFRKQVHKENNTILKDTTSSQLVVYKNKTAFDKRHASVDEEKVSLTQT
jgi:hypothetical protein